MKSALQIINERVNAQERVDELRNLVVQLARPSSIHRPRVFRDGDSWCALLGENLQEGVCGFGKSPDEACRKFDLEWVKDAK